MTIKTTATDILAPPAPRPGDGTWGSRALDGHLLSAVNGGGRTSRAFDSNRTVLDSREKFSFTCNV